eukprot:TRINITY_DN4732_c0_g2_i6.p1 TRINITY_DN4732_c0_g2~~TRINITY_DN4732_c0_g2_i6.p1  ORF type:complete len:458 (+),score=145.83 TRINITY_DN4732_c0_g2_i6:2-1375(+)
MAGTWDDANVVCAPPVPCDASLLMAPGTAMPNDAAVCGAAAPPVPDGTECEFTDSTAGNVCTKPKCMAGTWDDPNVDCAPPPTNDPCYSGTNPGQCGGLGDCTWDDRFKFCHPTTVDPDPCREHIFTRACRYGTTKGPSSHRCIWDHNVCVSDIDCTPGTTEGRCKALYGCTFHEHVCMKPSDIPEEEDDDNTLLWIIIIVVVVLVCLALLIFLIWKMRKDRAADRAVVDALEADRARAMQEKQATDVQMVEIAGDRDRAAQRDAGEIQHLEEELYQERQALKDHQEKIDELHHIAALKQEMFEKDELLRQDQLLAQVAPMFTGVGVSPHAEGAYRPRAGHDVAHFQGSPSAASPQLRQNRFVRSLPGGGGAAAAASPFRGNATRLATSQRRAAAVPAAATPEARPDPPPPISPPSRRSANGSGAKGLTLGPAGGAASVVEDGEAPASPLTPLDRVA